MKRDHTNFWQRFQSGIDVALGGETPEKLLGVRDGLARFFHDGQERLIPISVTPQSQDESQTPLPLTDTEILTLAQTRARDLKHSHEDRFAFYAGCEAGLLQVTSGGLTRYLVRSWTVVIGMGEETWGSSGSVQLPESILSGLGEGEIPFAVPGTRRSGGMVSSLTGGLDTVRDTTALATFNAISTLMYGRLDHRLSGNRLRR